jgi:hypothetical protein
MAELTKVCRVTVIAEKILEDDLIQAFLQLGAKGYTCLDCSGRGAHHQVAVNPLTGQSLVRIEVFAKPEVAHAILEHIHKVEFTNYPVIGVLENVEAYARDTFF